MDYELEKLKDTYLEHKSIVLGIDFDDTIFPLSDDEYIIDRCRRVRKAIRDFNGVDPTIINSINVLYTNSDSQSLVYKKFITQNVFKIRVDYINESPILSGNGKPFFNLLLDDKAGLEESLQRLIKLTESL